MFAMILLASAGAEPPRFQVENKMPPFVVVNKIVAPAATVRENWGGSWGWMERGADGVYRQVPASGVAAPRPFPPGTITPGTLAQRAGVLSSPSQASTATARITTLAPTMAQFGGTNYCPPSG